MKKWIQPMAEVEKFVANEYVAACWNVKCTIPEEAKKDTVSDQFNPGDTHRAAFCGDSSHYQIKLDDNGVPVEMIETQTDGIGDRPCTLYTDGNYTTVMPISQLTNTKSLIYWRTSLSSSSRTWSHHGYIDGTSNHS
ncbi:MAG: hypothetical protein K6F00_11980 [Lachnospiraceae bacterium]|nr:hypothetical protein [Lachnospiraceae bacterium]